jgi:hypothetical protein
MANLIFYDEGHKYTVDGEEVPSVSELTRFISKEIYGDVNQVILDMAANRGTAVHKAAEALDKYGKVEVDDEHLPYLKAYLSFLKEIKPEWEKIEWPVNNGTLYAGTIDRYGTINSEKAIVDIKTTANIDKGHRVLYTAAQNLYRMAIENDHPVEAIYILQLRKDGTWRLLQVEKQNELAEACITLSLALKKRRRKKKEESQND